MRNREIELSYDKYDEANDNLTKISMLVPAKNQMCDCCRGEGRVDNPAFSNGITQSDREEMGEESFQNYMDGMYDVACPECKGARIIQVADVDQCTFAQKRFLVEVRRDQIEQAAFERENAAMHRAECWYMYQ